MKSTMEQEALSVLHNASLIELHQDMINLNGTFYARKRLISWVFAEKGFDDERYLDKVYYLVNSSEGQSELESLLSHNRHTLNIINEKGLENAKQDLTQMAIDYYREFHTPVGILKIPRIIHAVWLTKNGKKIAQKLLNNLVYIKLLLELPGYHYDFFIWTYKKELVNASDITFLENHDIHFREIGEIHYQLLAPHVFYHAFIEWTGNYGLGVAVDTLKIEAVRIHGGIGVDLDTFINRPLDEDLHRYSCAVVSKVGFFMCEAHHQKLEAGLSNLEKMYETGEDIHVGHTTAIIRNLTFPLDPEDGIISYPQREDILLDLDTQQCFLSRDNEMDNENSQSSNGFCINDPLAQKWHLVLEYNKFADNFEICPADLFWPGIDRGDAGSWFHNSL